MMMVRTSGLFLAILGLLLIAPAPSFAASGYVGIGVTLQQDNQNFVVSDVKRDGPAARAGVLRGDYIFRIDGRVTQGLPMETVVGYLRGDVGTRVVLNVYTGGAQQSRDVVAVREYIEVPCFIEGFVDLRLQGDDRYGTISGWVGSEYVNWYVDFGRVSAVFKGERLDLQLRFRGAGNYDITGWMHRQYMTWSGFGWRWNFYQACIPD